MPVFEFHHCSFYNQKTVNHLQKVQQLGAHCSFAKAVRAIRLLVAIESRSQYRNAMYNFIVPTLS